MCIQALWKRRQRVSDHLGLWSRLKKNMSSTYLKATKINHMIRMFNSVNNYYANQLPLRCCKQTSRHNNKQLVRQDTHRSLSAEQVGVLSKGLNFSPDTVFNLFQTMFDVNWFDSWLSKSPFFSHAADSGQPVMVKARKNVVNEFEQLLFEEQMYVMALQDLSNSQKEINDEVGCGVSLSNPSLPHQI